MSDQIPFATLYPYEPSVIADNEPQTTRVAMKESSYAMGRLLDEIRVEPGLGRNERHLASAMCFEAFDYDFWALSFPEVAQLGQLSKSETRKALEKLILAGFVKVVRNSELGVLFYLLQFPDDCELN